MEFQKIGDYLKNVRTNSLETFPNQECPQKTVIKRIENNENYMIKSLFAYANVLKQQLYYKDNLINNSCDLGNIIRDTVKEQNMTITELGEKADLKRKTIYMLMSGHGNYFSFVKVLKILNVDINIRKK